MVKTKAVVAGNSIGGFIATSMAADYPELVSGLILLNRCVHLIPVVSMEILCVY